MGPPGDEIAIETDKPPSNSTKEKYYIDSTYIHRPREGVEMRHPLKDGLGKIQGAGCVHPCSHAS